MADASFALIRPSFSYKNIAFDVNICYNGSIKTGLSIREEELSL